MNKKLKLTKAENEKIGEIIKTYFLEERNEELGDLAAYLLGEYLADKIGPYFYNRGIEDAFSYIHDKLEDLHSLKIIK